MANNKYRLFARGARGQEIREVIMAPDDAAARGKLPAVCRKRGIDLDPARDRLVRIVRPGIETQPVPLTA